jgi:ATPases involved in chromosome partitioning
MVDLTAEMAGLWSALGPSRGARGRVFQIVSANSGEGTSTVARELARLAAVRARRPVWLIDGDLFDQGQMDAIAGMSDRYGRLGRAVRASPNGSSFYSIMPPLMSRDGRLMRPSALLTARPALGGRLWVTRFASEHLRSGHRVDILPEPAYWDALRGHAETIIIDSPAGDRSDAAVMLAPFVDSTVLVVAAETTEAGGPLILRDEIEAAGGHIAGLVVNRSRYAPPKFLRGLTG